MYTSFFLNLRKFLKFGDFDPCTPILGLYVRFDLDRIIPFQQFNVVVKPA